MRSLNRRLRTATARRGFTTPLVAAALLLGVAGLALILDRLWLDAAQVELTTASEASALAAGRELASDDRLRTQVDDQLRANRALNAAVTIAGQNTVAGVPVELNLAAEDVQLGRVVASSETGPSTFLQTDVNPTHVRVTAHRSRARGNPLSLWISELTRQPYGDVVAHAEAGLDNQLDGFRPFAGAPVPALPIAIWRDDPAKQRKDTWQYAIEQRQGADQYGFDDETKKVTSGADGIPELTLRSQPTRGATDKVNFQVVDVGSGFDAEKLARQFEHGFASTDLDAWNGELRLNASGLEMAATPILASADRDALEAVLGQSRICLLYAGSIASGPSRQSRVMCIEFVAIRVLAVKDLSDGSAEVVVQPSVLTTRTAMTDPASAKANPYVFRLTLTK